MSKAKWIWYGNDFEIYHSMLLHCRREERGCDYPCGWRLPRPEVAAVFSSKMLAQTDTVLHVYTRGRGSVDFGEGRRPVNCDIAVKKGEYSVIVRVYDAERFPAIFIDGDYLKTDESWLAERCDQKPIPVGFEPHFTEKTDDPSVFPFEYEEIFPASVTNVNRGKLYDFGREYFGRVTLGGIAGGDSVTLCYGESEAEALDLKNSVIRETVDEAVPLQRPSRAFRYIYVKSSLGNDIKLSAEYEFLPIEDKAKFSCDDEAVEKIWDMCSLTFHLNSREFYLDGIKRDRWVWSGDAYQSFMVNRYLYDDPAIIKRTIRALLGKPPYVQHINTINDYSALLIIGVYEHFFSSADCAFVKTLWADITALYEYITSRLDENGYVVKRSGDWIFIDWSEFDKTGAFCAEQILLWQVYRCMSRLSAVVGEEDTYSERAEELREKIMRDFWREEKGAFIDSFSSGKNNVSRHANIFAILYDFVSGEQAKKIAESVLYNDEIVQITTPYFKLFELISLCKLGNVEIMQEYLNSYWGEMMKLGATTVWEHFDPAQSGREHLEMYGAEFGKSLCHAWGAGPIYLLGRFVAGVYPTAVGSAEFTVSPNPGKYKRFHAVVPMNGGTVRVDFDGAKFRVLSTVSGGTLVIGSKAVKLPENEEISLDV